MKIFTVNPSSWGDKVNFVDHENTVVGYDMGQSCCEHAGWYVSEVKRNDTKDEETITEGLEEYRFDREFFEHEESRELDYGGMIRFRLTANGKPDLFLQIFNSHNGYYAHGFTVEHSGTVVRSDSL